MKFSDGEKLILWMLADLHKKLKISSDIDPDFVIDALSKEQTWAFSWKYSGIPFDDKTTPQVVKDVCDYLDMWDVIEHAWEQLSIDDKEKVENEAKPFGKKVKFPGFDGNNEADYIAAAHFLIHDLDRWSRFAKHDLNSHMPMVEGYARMYKIFDPIRVNLMDEGISAHQLIAILKERIHPSRR